MAAPVEKKFQPGASIHGNFIDYYSFNPAKNRIENIPQTLLNDLKLGKSIVCLDIGCNSGELTTELYHHLKSHKEELNLQFLGIDLDPLLIDRCSESNKIPKNITFKTLDFMDKENREIQLNTYLKTKNSTKFDITFAFSITMWIHINNGDVGLNDFLTQISKNTKNLIIEPQPWKCYRNALRRIKRSNDPEKHLKFQRKIQNLKIREKIEDKIINYLTTNCKMQIIKEFDKTKWNRRLILFQSNFVTN